VEGEPEDNLAAAWTYAGVLVGFKFVGLAIILWAMAQAGVLGDTLGFIVLYHVPWVVAALALAYWPLMFWFRRLRARSRRSHLLWSEFHVDEPVGERPGRTG